MSTEKPIAVIRGDPQSSVDPIEVHIGQRIRARRLFLQKSEIWLAERLDIRLVDVQAIEFGRVRIKAPLLCRIAVCLDVDVGFFFRDEDIVPTPEAPDQPWLRDVDRWFCDQVLPYEGAFLALARKLTGNLESARDLVQEAYAKIFADERWRMIAHPRAYVIKVIKSLGLRYLQRSRIVPIRFLANLDQMAQADEEVSAFDIVSTQEQLQRIMDVIDHLPPQCRKVMIMRKLQDIPTRDIARKLGLSLSTVENHIARGLVMLAKALQGQ